MAEHLLNRIRVIPALLLKGDGLVKTVRFQKPVYVGDPVNTVRIFNEKEVDEIVVLDIEASHTGSPPNFEKIEEIAGECFMPMGYGGGITTVDQIRKILFSGAEKVIINTSAQESPNLIREAAAEFGSQSIVVALDVSRNLFGRYRVFTHGGRRSRRTDPVAAARQAVEAGAGEILLYSIDRDGTYQGFDTGLIRRVTDAVSVPVIACGGASSVDDFSAAVCEGGAAAVAAGSMFVFHGPHKAVLINFPDEQTLQSDFFAKCS